MSRKPKPILIADPDPEFFQKLKDDPLSENLTLTYVDSGGEAQTTIIENRNEFSAVVVSPDISTPSGVSVVKCSMMYQPMVPVYMTNSFRSEVDEAIDHDRLGISKVLAKPFGMKEIMEELGPALKLFDASSALEVSKNNKDEIGADVEDKDGAFRPIKAELFVSGKKSLFDVYVKLRADKYVKILQAGDDFDFDRLMVYLNRGVNYFYIRKEAQENYVNYCDTITAKITKSEKLDVSKKFGFLFNQAEVTINTLHDLGVDNESILYAQKYTKNVFQVIDGFSEENDFLKNLLNELGQFAHPSSVVVVASMISKEMGVETDKSVQNLGIAALLHDCGMEMAPDKDDMYATESEAKLWDEEEVEEKLASRKVYGDEKNKLEKMYREHAERGARIVEGIKGIPAVVPQIIRQHHALEEKERGDYKGGSIHPLAEILEISDSFVKVMKRFRGDNVDKNYLMKSLINIVARFPRRTREPFEKVFGMGKEK